MLATAGRDWATREVEGFASISNARTIAGDGTATSLGDPEGARVDFAAAVGVPGPSIACGAPERRAASHRFLERRAGRITVRGTADLLRDTGEEAGYHPADGERSARVRMYAGPFEARYWQATGSLISDVRPDSGVVWATGTSGPDCSVFKPIFFGVAMPDLGPMPRESDTAGAYWWRHERLHRRVMADYAAIIADLRPEIEALEDRFFAGAETVRRGAAADKAAFVAACWAEADALEARWLARLESRPYRVGHPGLRGHVGALQRGRGAGAGLMAAAPERRRAGDLPEARPAVTGAQLGERLRALRKGMGWTLQELARSSGVSLSTLSKIETAQVAPSFDTLAKAARGLGITFEALLAPAAAEPPAPASRRAGGRLIVTRKGGAVGFSTPMYDYRVHANGLRRKRMTPLVMAVKARSPEDVTSWSSHEGEEFVLVRKGAVEMHTEFYEPARLEAGDSAYIDSGMAHLFLNVGEDEAIMASICCSDAADGPGLIATMPAAAEPVRC